MGVWSDLTLDPSARIAKLKSAYNSLIIGLQVWDGEPTYRKSWAGNILVWSDLTLGTSYKVQQWFTGFGELSFRWIQICKSAYNLLIIGPRGLQSETNL